MNFNALSNIVLFFIFLIDSILFDVRTFERSHSGNRRKSVIHNLHRLSDINFVILILSFDIYEMRVKKYPLDIKIEKNDRNGENNV